MIIEVAFGVVLGVLILTFWRELIALGITALVVGLGLAALLFCGVFLFEAAQSAKVTPLWHMISSTITFIFSIIVTVMFFSAGGHVLEKRTNLRGREAYILGAAFPPLFMVSVGAITWLIFNEHSSTEYLLALIYLGALLAAWVILLVECRRRIKRRKLKPSFPSREVDAA